MVDSPIIVKQEWGVSKKIQMHVCLHHYLTVRSYTLSYLPTYSLTHLLTYSLTYLLTYLLTYSLTYLLTHLLT